MGGGGGGGGGKECVSLRFGEGGSCSVKSEKLRGKLKPHNGSIMGLVSESRRRAGGEALLPSPSLTSSQRNGVSEATRRQQRVPNRL